MIIKAIIITVFISICLAIIIEGINQQNIKFLNREKDLNAQVIALFQNERDRTDTLWRIIKHIQSQLNLLNAKECPEEEKANIPNEIIDWINQLEETRDDKNNGLR